MSGYALGLLCVAAAVGIAAFVAFDQLEQRRAIRSSLRQIDDYADTTVATERDRELLKPVRERAIEPILGGLTGLGRSFTPVGYLDKVRKKFTTAGRSAPDAVDRFLAVRAVCFVLMPIVVVVMLAVLHMTSLAGILITGLLLVVLAIGPDSWLNRLVEERKHQIQVTLPDVLDLLVISVEAGLGFEQALDRVIASVPGPLTQEFARMLGEVRAGATRAAAMRALDDRCDVPELRSFVMAILQADTFGVSIGRVLRTQGAEMRVKRRQLAQERAQKAPVKMLIPMVFCVFPALFVVVLGPAVLSIMDTIGK
jgi:tight adherence protein C